VFDYLCFCILLFLFVLRLAVYILIQLYFVFMCVCVCINLCFRISPSFTLLSEGASTKVYIYIYIIYNISGLYDVFFSSNFPGAPGGVATWRQEKPQGWAQGSRTKGQALTKTMKTPLELLAEAAGRSDYSKNRL
jgi:hypothetical protein